MAENPDIRHAITAAAAVCEQQEEWAKAAFYQQTSLPDQAAFGAPGLRPWRGIMNPRIVHLINVLEEMDHYEGPLTADPAVAAALD